jgi:hypothetical protein
MFKWVKKLIIKKAMAYLTDEVIDPLIDDMVKKYDSGLSDEEEKKHLINLKKFIRPLVTELLEKWANK